MDARETKPRLDSLSHDGAKSDQIKAEIDQTRERMDHTLSELGERLNPRHLMDEVVEYFRDNQNAAKIKEGASRAGRALLDAIQEHPLPLLLVGGGLAWLAVEQRRRSQGYYPDAEDYEEAEYLTDMDTSWDEEGPAFVESGVEIEMSECDDLPSQGSSFKSSTMEKAQQIKEHLTAGAHSAKEKVTEAAGKVGEKARHLRDQTRERTAALSARTRQLSSRIKQRASHAYHRTEDSLANASDSYPLAVGVGCLTIGLLAGLLLPRTRKEDEMIGETSEQFRDRAKLRGKEVLERGRKAAKAAVHAVSEQAKTQGFTPEAIKEKVRHVAEEVRESARESVRHEGLDTASLKEKAGQALEEAKLAAKKEVMPRSTNPSTSSTTTSEFKSGQVKASGSDCGTFPSSPSGS